MKKGRTDRGTLAFERALARRVSGKGILKLYVAGASERSRNAILRAQQLCESELSGQYVLEVIDVYQQPLLARDNQIVATPTLVRDYPKPVRRLIGNLTNTANLLVGLDLDGKGQTT